MTGTDAPRIAPLPREEWDDNVRAALGTGFSAPVAERFFATGADAIPMPNVLATLMRHPDLAGPFLAYNNVLLRTPTLDPRARELLVLRVAARTRAEYEWAQHVRLATAAGITAAEIDAVAGDDEHGWTGLDAALVTAADELVDDFCITDATWERLAAHLDDRQLVELVFVVGTYTGLAMAFNSFGLQLDDDLLAHATPSSSEEQ